MLCGTLNDTSWLSFDVKSCTHKKSTGINSQNANKYVNLYIRWISALISGALLMICFVAHSTESHKRVCKCEQSLLQWISLSAVAPLTLLLQQLKATTCFHIYNERIHFKSLKASQFLIDSFFFFDWNIH